MCRSHTQSNYDTFTSHFSFPALGGIPPPKNHHNPCFIYSVHTAVGVEYEVG